mgnify:CR=1 FL=1
MNHATQSCPIDFEAFQSRLRRLLFAAKEKQAQEEIEQWVGETVPWYDGSLASVKGGVNFTTDLDNASGYGKYVLALKTRGPVANFSDVHKFAKNYKDVDVVAYRAPNSKKWIKV